MIQITLFRNRKLTVTTILLCLNLSLLIAQVTERKRPDGWENLVNGGRFMDRFLPIPNLGGVSSNTWGAKCVIPRDTINGIEDRSWSYWGGNIRKLNDGKYHMFVCRWAEDSPKGHMQWPKSEVVHAISNNPFGPFKVVANVGKGHNPEWYITDDGKFIIYVINGFYISDSVNGPWEFKKFKFNTRDRKIIEGLSNLTFAKREDGSFIMICRGGGVWVSKDGYSEWNQITDSRVYPPVKGHFEDPVIWKTDVQYHLIVNDWLGRIAWYLRSKDGVNWKTDAGEAYLPGITKYENGVNEDWFKYERLKVQQDELGRATHANFAVIDTLKHYDLANDNHNSKNIVIPLLVGKQLSIVNKKTINKKTKEISVKIKAEKDFNPNRDLDISSLRFGASEEVNFGRGSKAKKIIKKGDNAIIVFDGNNNGITDKNFVAKLLGKSKDGKLLFGYARLPEVKYIESVLSAKKPILSSNGKNLSIKVDNFGQVKSRKSTIHIYQIKENEKIEIGSAKIKPINAYESKTLSIKPNKKFSADPKSKYLIVINKDKKEIIKNLFK